MAPEHRKSNKIEINTVNRGYSGFSWLINLSLKMLYFSPFGHNMDTVYIMAMREGGKLDYPLLTVEKCLYLIQIIYKTLSIL